MPVNSRRGKRVSPMPSALDESKALTLQIYERGRVIYDNLVYTHQWTKETPRATKNNHIDAERWHVNGAIAQHLTVLARWDDSTASRTATRLVILCKDVSGVFYGGPRDVVQYRWAECVYDLKGGSRCVLGSHWRIARKGRARTHEKVARIIEMFTYNYLHSPGSMRKVKRVYTHGTTTLKRDTEL